MPLPCGLIRGRTPRGDKAFWGGNGSLGERDSTSVHLAQSPVLFAAHWVRTHTPGGTSGPEPTVAGTCRLSGDMEKHLESMYEVDWEEEQSWAPPLTGGC